MKDCPYLTAAELSANDWTVILLKHLSVGKRAQSKLRLFSNLWLFYFSGPCLSLVHIDIASGRAKSKQKSLSFPSLHCTYIQSQPEICLSQLQPQFRIWPFTWLRSSLPLTVLLGMIVIHIQVKWVSWPQQHSLLLAGRISIPTKLERWGPEQECWNFQYTYLLIQQFLKCKFFSNCCISWFFFQSSEMVVGFFWSCFKGFWFSLIFFFFLENLPTFSFCYSLKSAL